MPPHFEDSTSSSRNRGAARNSEILSNYEEKTDFRILNCFNPPCRGGHARYFLSSSLGMGLYSLECECLIVSGRILQFGRLSPPPRLYQPGVTARSLTLQTALAGSTFPALTQCYEDPSPGTRTRISSRGSTNLNNIERCEAQDSNPSGLSWNM